MSDQPPPGHEHGVDRQRFVWGVIWRTVAWGLPLGGLLGGVYGFCLNFPFIAPGDALLSGNPVVVGSMVIGGVLGSVGGFVLSLVAGFAIAHVPTPPPASPRQIALYLRTVRRVAAASAVVVWCLPSLPALPTAGITTIFFFIVPAAMAGSVAYVLAPRAVRWYLDPVHASSSEG